MKTSSSFVVCLVAFLMLGSTAFPADGGMFNYQGRVLVQGIPYTGAGQMKVAILAASGVNTVVSLWSNDGSSAAGSEPVSGFPVQVSGGVFDAMIGDANLGVALPAILFNRDDELKVRVWFNDGIHGFQQLAPDRRITNPRRLGASEIHDPTTIYVNGASGNDINAGLSASSAKKTIQAAVAMVPARLHNNVTIEIAQGTYRESVNVTGVMADPGYSLTLLGDKTTTPTETVAPNVRLTGTDNDSTHLKVRENGLTITGCQNVNVNGILLDYFAKRAFLGTDSRVKLNRCKASNSARGYEISGGGESADYCWATYNPIGFFVFHGQVDLTSCGVTDATSIGISGNHGRISLSGTTSIKRSFLGIFLEGMSYFITYGGTHYLNNNNVGLQISTNSCARNLALMSYYGNGSNLLVSGDSVAINTPN